MDNYNIPNHIKGDTWAGMTVNIRDASGNALVPDLSGARMQVRPRPSVAPLLSLSSPSGGITIDATGWNITIEPRIVDILAGTHYYDLETTNVSGEVKTYLGGTWTILADITQ